MLRMRSLCLALVATLLASAASAQWQTNLVDNPSAEDDANHDGQPDLWHGDGFRSPAKVQWETCVAHSGRHSLRISDSLNPGGRQWNETTGRWRMSAKKPVTPRQPYALEAWIKTEGVTGRADVRIAWFAEKKWLAESVAPPVRETHDWQHVTVTAQAPPEAVGAVVYLGLAQSKGTAWFDDVALVAGTRLPANYRPVDLSALSNACLAKLRLAESGPVSSASARPSAQEPFPLVGRALLPAGDVQLRGVPFHGLDPAGKDCVALKGKGTPALPVTVEIPVGRTCETLYFLHGCSHGSAGSRVAEYEIGYDDGSVARIPLRLGREIGDFARTAESRESAVGRNGLSLFPAANPSPDKVIRTIRFGTAGGPATPVLAALTTADGPAVLTQQPLDYEVSDRTGWFPFTFPLDDTNLDAIDLTGLLDAPAGRHGFLAVRPDGHFYFADGQRARFFGTNICGRAATPDKEAAARLAARLAKYGVNLLRIHAIDGQWGPLIDRSRPDSRHFDPAALDRLDFFFAELKKRGIYVYFDGLDYRQFKDGDGVKDASQFEHGWRHSIKGARCFNARLIELQKEFDAKFFTHYNPYTKLRYVDDPAVAVVEITNENSVFYFQNTELTLPCYRVELEARWNDWLRQQYGDRRSLARAWTNIQGECALLAEEDPARGNVVLPLKFLYQKPEGVDFAGPRSPARVNAMVRFLFEIERSYYRQMSDHLRAIGVRVPITGTNQTFCPASNYADAACDFMSRNNYWQHPNVHATPFFTFHNRAVMDSDLAKVDNPITEVASSSVAGKPLIVPEFNFPWPNEYRSECLLLMTAYACLQDWDGLLFFAYDPEQQTLSWFGNQSDPVRWGEYPAAALMFHRHDVETARRTVHVGYSEAEVFKAGPNHRGREFSPYRDLVYVSQVRNVYGGQKPSGKGEAIRGAGYRPAASATAPAASKRVSDTGQLAIDPVEGLFTLDTPRTKGAAGFLRKAGRIGLPGLKIRSTSPFAAVVVTSLDHAPIASARRLLLTAVGRAENTGQAFAGGKRTVPERGRLPVLAEPVRAEVAIDVAGPAEVYALDETGKRRQRVPAVQEGRTLEVKLDEVHSPWCEIVVTPRSNGP